MSDSVPVEGQTFYENSECAHCSTRLYGKRVFLVPANGGEALVCESCANQPKLAEGAVLPERPKHVTHNTEDGPVLYHSYVAPEKHFKLLETKLAEAIAQRDALLHYSQLCPEHLSNAYRRHMPAAEGQCASCLLAKATSKRLIAEGALATERALQFTEL